MGWHSRKVAGSQIECNPWMVHFSFTDKLSHQRAADILRDQPAGKTVLFQ